MTVLTSLLLHKNCVWIIIIWLHSAIHFKTTQNGMFIKNKKKIVKHYGTCQ